MARNKIVAAVAVAALAGGGAGAGVVALTHGSGGNGSQSGTSAAATTTVVEGGASTVANGQLTIGQIAKQDSKSVVEIDSTTSSGSSFFGGGSSTATAEGSGFVYDTQGDIITNEHVVDGASSVTVKFSDGSTYKGTIVGKDTSTDIAVVHVNAPASSLSPLTLADSDAVQVGDGVVAIGNPFGLDDSVSSGIVSAVGREITAPDNETPIDGAIQTDAAINHGNSGGPLLNMKGQVIGITSQIQSDSDGNEGVGFAVPANLVHTIATELITSGSAQHALLGVTPATAADNSGVKVTSVESNSAASGAGIKKGDVITALDGTAITNASQLRAIISADKPGATITLTIRRSGSTKTVHATLGTKPASS
ncbi:MAG TPA: trypsin-like peptidase domain-containing protein [Gaiellaceae bacterium]|jgi:putative serine protease PepD|nr:trypsin-like peptidase domain-containing protein [Gaiellaceae bacterium]